MDKKVTLVLPFYNEEANIKAVIAEAAGVLKDIAKDFEIIAVDDGSADETRHILDKLSKKQRQLKVIHHKKNAGYGRALKTGIEAATGEYVLLCDGDGQFYMKELKEFVKYLKEYKVVLGYRIDRKDPWIRKLNSMIYNWFARVLVGVKIKDINCAMKGFHMSVLKGLRYRTAGAIINSDILSQVLSRGVRFKEIGVNHRPRTAGEQTGARLSVIANAMKEFVNVFIDEFPKRRKEMLFNFRILFGFMLAVIVIAVVDPADTAFFWLGFLLASAGVFVRNWASGHIKKSKILCTTGPYSLVRHPLYFGSTLIGMGALMSLWNRESPLVSVFFVTIFLILFIFVYVPKIISEETNLIEWFGDEYEEYKKRVGLLFPLFKKFDISPGDFRLTYWKKNKEYQSIIGLLAFYLIMLIKR